MTATQYTPWGQQPLPPRAANDNVPMMIGLTGKRNVGKSTVARLLVEEFGFHAVHAFGAGKEAAAEWFRHIGCSKPSEMVYGDLKDKPCAELPGGVAPRFFLEKFGRFMGAEMGVEWTLGIEIAAARRYFPQAPIVVESLVYEAPWFKERGGIIWRLERPGHSGPAGIESDSVQALIEADVTIAARSVAELTEAVRDVMGAQDSFEAAA